MNIGIIGTGYVGLVSGACLADIGHSVTCIDIDSHKIDKLNSGVIPIYEPGLQDIVTRNLNINSRISFETDYSTLNDTSVIFIAVGTPQQPSGEADLSFFNIALDTILNQCKKEIVLVIKSTVPISTNLEVQKKISLSGKKVHLVNNPEFLREGSAVNDFFHAERIIIGSSSEYANKLMKEIYFPLTKEGTELLIMSNTSAEITKYAANAFLAMKISFINEMSILCDKTKGSISDVIKGISTDSRIGKKYLQPGPGYGGSCFPKDVNSLIYCAKKADIPLFMPKAINDSNNLKKKYLISKIEDQLKDDNLSKLTLTLWGVAFKANTDDIRESPSLQIAEYLIKKGCKINIYDPCASRNFQEHFNHNPLISSFDDKYESLNSSSGLIILTEWNEFLAPDFNLIHSKLISPHLFDFRYLYSPLDENLKKFNHIRIG